MSEQEKKSKTEPVDSPVSRALIMICEKCGRKLNSDDEKSPSRAIQKQLKYELKEKFGKGYARAVTSSCMDICPKDRIAIGIAHLKPEHTEFFLVEGQDIEADCAAIIGKFD